MGRRTNLVGVRTVYGSLVSCCQEAAEREKRMTDIVVGRTGEAENEILMEFYDLNSQNTKALVKLAEGDLWICYKNNSRYVTQRKATKDDLFKLKTMVSTRLGVEGARDVETYISRPVDIENPNGGRETITKGEWYRIHSLLDHETQHGGE